MLLKYSRIIPKSSQVGELEDSAFMGISYSIKGNTNAILKIGNIYDMKVKRIEARVGREREREVNENPVSVYETV